MARVRVNRDELPSHDNIDFRNAGSRDGGRVLLPTPNEVRRRAEEDGTENVFKAYRPKPVYFRPLGLLVKWGSDITIAEGQCLWFIRKYLRSTVPVPEIYGWARDGGQMFLYMELVSGNTLSDRWPQLSEVDRTKICEQLRTIIASWRTMEQVSMDPPTLYERIWNRIASWYRMEQAQSGHWLGQIGGQALRDITFEDTRYNSYPAGPFATIEDFHRCFANLVVRNNPKHPDARTSVPALKGLSDDMPIVFTHADLDQSNILIARADDGDTRIVAIIDWHQAGWYPQAWEWLKAHAVAFPSCDWKEKYVSRILDPAPYEYHYSWEYVSMSTM